jgi:hypothetical protein
MNCLDQSHFMVHIGISFSAVHLAPPLSYTSDGPPAYREQDKYRDDLSVFIMWNPLNRVQRHRELQHHDREVDWTKLLEVQWKQPEQERIQVDQNS